VKKIVFYNFIIFLIFLLIIELIFGYWFDENDFGFFVRNERLIEKYYKVKHHNKIYDVIYKRNFYGFRGEETEPNNIKIVFEGGSTGNQRFTPEKFTIVGSLNKAFMDDNIEIRIFNASTDGKTTRGYVNDFEKWFSKIKNFHPKIFIFYTGINDSYWFQKEKFDIGERTGIPERLADYIKNNSITAELLHRLYNKFFSFELTLKLKAEYNPNYIDEDLYKHYSYVNYDKAKKIFTRSGQSENDKNLINRFKNRLNNLDKIINEKKIIPIFITQIQYNGIGNINLFLINEELKDFAKNNNYYLIKLDEQIDNIGEGDYYDMNHTQILGSKKIADTIFPELKKILLKELQRNTN